jgi:hypothetical protein
MDKNQLRAANRFYLADPTDLDTFDEFAEYIEAILSSPCSIWEEDGNLTLLS